MKYLYENEIIKKFINYGVSGITIAEQLEVCELIKENEYLLENIKVKLINNELKYFKDDIEIDEFDLMIEIEKYYQEEYSKILKEMNRNE